MTLTPPITSNNSNNFGCVTFAFNFEDFIRHHFSAQTNRFAFSRFIITTKLTNPPLTRSANDGPPNIGCDDLVYVCMALWLLHSFTLSQMSKHWQDRRLYLLMYGCHQGSSMERKLLVNHKCVFICGSSIISHFSAHPIPIYHFHAEKII